MTTHKTFHPIYVSGQWAAILTEDFNVNQYPKALASRIVFDKEEDQKVIFRRMFDGNLMWKPKENHIYPELILEIEIVEICKRCKTLWQDECMEIEGSHELVEVARIVRQSKEVEAVESQEELWNELLNYTDSIEGTIWFEDEAKSKFILTRRT